MSYSWFTEYLLIEYNPVVYEDKVSAIRKIISGVSKASVLGPILFLIYLNDLSIRITYSKTLLYADDLQIYIQVPYKDFKLGISLLQNYIKVIEDYQATSSCPKFSFIGLLHVSNW